jgi:hypothetical protein
MADRSRGACHVKAVMTAIKKQSTTATPYVTQIKLVWSSPAAAMVVNDEATSI